jgi:hypothetical protein
MKVLKHLFQIGKESRREDLSPREGFSWDELHGKGKSIDSLDRLGNPLHPSESGIDLPLLLNEPKS